MDYYCSLIRQVLDRFFDNLNEMQREAVYTVNGPVLILAGAGSGKTTAIINRIVCMVLFGDPLSDEAIRSIAERRIAPDDTAFLESYDGDKSPESISRLRDIIAYEPIAPWRIAAVTFTNKAAGELKARLSDTLGTDGESVAACTFHSFCMRILRRDIERTGYSAKFSVYDADDSGRLIKTCISELDIDDSKFPVRSVAAVISGAKDKLITPEGFLDYAMDTLDPYRARTIARIYKRYQQKLMNADALDFDDIICVTVRLLEQNPDLLSYYARRYRYMCVDEFQDTNAAQYRLAELLCGEHKNLCVVGDDDQSIYKFRGATIENIMEFDAKFDPTTIVIKLEQNYRSTGMIVNAANSIISHNFHIHQKELWTNNPTGDPVIIHKAYNDMAEGKFVADTIKKSMSNHSGGVSSGGTLSYSDFAVLYRMNAQSNAAEQALSSARIPYKVIGGLRFYDRKEIKDVLGYLHVFNNPRDIVHFRRIVNEPKRGIGEATLSMIEQIAADLNLPPLEICKNAGDYLQLEKKKSVLGRFADMMAKLSDELLSGKPLDAFIDTLITRTGLKEALEKLNEKQSDKTEFDEGDSRLENIGELRSDIARYIESQDTSQDINQDTDSKPDNLSILGGFLESIALYTDVDRYEPGTDTVKLLTVHAAKGLEWNTVFLIGMEDGIFPSARSMDEAGGIEEDRRLAYVAVTRAKEHLYISHAVERKLYGSTKRNPISRFVREIDPAYTLKDGIGNPGISKPITVTKPQTANPHTAVESAKIATHFTPGERVIHPKFGAGMVISAVAVGGDTMLEVAFDEVGTKKLMANFAKMRKE
jgi:DNA helicase-2/ATP-dependent DNA helicase PcrA